MCNVFPDISHTNVQACFCAAWFRTINSGQPWCEGQILTCPGRLHRSRVAAEGDRRPPLLPVLTPSQLFPPAAVWQPLFTSSTDWEASALGWRCTHAPLFYLLFRVSGSMTGSPVILGSMFHSELELGFPPDQLLLYPIFWNIDMGLRVDGWWFRIDVATGRKGSEWRENTAALCRELALGTCRQKSQYNRVAFSMIKAGAGAIFMSHLMWPPKTFGSFIISKHHRETAFFPGSAKRLHLFPVFFFFPPALWSKNKQINRFFSPPFAVCLRRDPVTWTIPTWIYISGGHAAFSACPPTVFSPFIAD